MNTYGKAICVNKKKFYTKEKAWLFSLYYFKQYGLYGSPYKCAYCRKYHTTQKRAQIQPNKMFINEFNKWFGSKVL